MKPKRSQRASAINKIVLLIRQIFEGERIHAHMVHGIFQTSDVSAGKGIRIKELEPRSIGMILATHPEYFHRIERETIPKFCDGTRSMVMYEVF